MRKWILISLLLVFSACAAQAAPWAVVVGDFDGFGFNGVDGPDTANVLGPWTASNGPPLTAADGTAADTNGDGVLEPNLPPPLIFPGLGSPPNPITTTVDEFLPDVNGDGVVRALSVDNWDNRDATEAAGGADAGVTYVNSSTDGAGTTGVEWTDITISRTYAIAAATQDNALGLFPDAGGTALPNDAVFDFKFKVSKAVQPTKQPISFALIFGDYDVPAADSKIIVTGPGGVVDIPLVPQAPNKNGLVQGAVASIPFNDIFTDGGLDWLGDVSIEVFAQLEPYYAVDAVALGNIGVIPEPGTYMLFGLGALGLLAWRRRRAA